MPIPWIDDELAALDRQGLLRTRGEPFPEAGPIVHREGRALLNLCGNDYLSLAGTRGGGEAGHGAGASRLVVGDLRAHETLEIALANWMGVEATLLFSSGYAANVGCIAALAGTDDLIVSDERNHASIIDGCRLSRARVVVVPHRDAGAIGRALTTPARRRWVVTDGYFSMDGDVAPVRELRRLCDEAGACLYVDEAHALGVLGPEGRGVCARAAIEPDVRIGTLGKAFGAAGAFVAGSRSLVRWLWNRARSFVFSTGLSPLIATAALEALDRVRSDTARAALEARTLFFRQSLASRHVVVATDSEGPIVPVILGDIERTRRAAASLLARGIFVHPILPPTVAPGSSRLRLTVQAGHSIEALEAAAVAIAEAVA